MVENRREEERNQNVSISREGAGSAGPGTEEILEEECSDLLALKDEEVKNLQDRVLRLAAEMENTRKRLERERSEGICFANETLIRDLLPVVDNLERAIKHAQNGADVQNLLEGIRMTAKSFLDVLAKYGCVPFESVGKPFDPKFHDAIMQQDSTEYPPNTVIEELQKGYTLHDRLLRPAMVIVSKGGKS